MLRMMLPTECESEESSVHIFACFCLKRLCLNELVGRLG